MPLPSFGSHHPGGKKLFSIAESGGDVENDSDSDDVLAILRSRNLKGVTEPRAGNRESGLSRSSPAKAEENGENRTSVSSKNSQAVANEHLANRSTSSGRPSSSSRINVEEANRLEQIVESHEQIKATIACIERNQHDDANSSRERHSEILERISATNDEVDTLCQEVRHLQSLTSSNIAHVEDISKSMSSLVNGTTKGQRDLEALSEIMTLSNAEHRESLATLKAQVESLFNEKEGFEAEKNALAIEKERLSRERTKLERSEALFEQRKIAAREEIETADEVMSTIREAEARLEDEMERLAHLSEYVRKKDEEARAKLEQGGELSKRLEEMDASVKHRSDINDRQYEELSEKRTSLARERVSLLMERARDRENDRLPKGNASFHGSSGFDLDRPSLSAALASLKDDLITLRHEQRNL